MGRRPLYREAKDGARERYMGKINASTSWFQGKSQSDNTMEEYHSKGPMRRHPWRKQDPPQGGGQDDRPVEGVIFVPHTTESDLQRKLQAVDNEVTKALKMGRTRYVERAGTKLKDKLVNKNIWIKNNGGWGRVICYECKSTKGTGISCRLEWVCYELVCLKCEEQKKRTIYIGETSRSAQERIYEHMRLFKGKKSGDPEKNQSNSVFCGHSRDSHNGSMKTDDWKIKIVSAHRTPLSRQLTEAVRIHREKPDE